MNKRIEIVDLLRGFAIISMIIGHSFIVYPINIARVSWCSFIQKWIYFYHMELFFICAGMIYVCVDYKQYIKKKMKRIMIPYIVFNVLSFVVSYLGGDMVNNHISLKDFFVRIVFYGGDYWFLYTMFAIYMIYPLVDKLIGKKIIVKGIVVIFLIMLNDLSLTGVFNISSIVYYITFFIVGNTFKDLKFEIRNKKIWIGIICSLIMTIVTVKCTFDSGIIKSVRGFSLIFLLFVVIDSMKNLQNIIVLNVKKLLKVCSKFSLQIYLFNGYFLVFLRVLICSLLKISSPLIISMCLSIGCILFAILISMLVKKNKFLCFLCGLPYEKRER